MNDQGGAQLTVHPDGARASIRLFHPKGNIVTAQMIAECSSALDAVAANPHVKLLTIEAAGRDFSYGASIPEHAPGEIDRVLPQAHALIEKLLDAPAPTAALVKGKCLGGGFEIAMACDFIFAEASAIFGLPEIKLGVFPPTGSALLPWRVGHGRAVAAILTGRAGSAAEWLDAGLVTAVSADGEVERDVARWFEANLAPQSAAALRHAAQAARLGLKRHAAAVLPQLERLYLDRLMTTADAAEGLTAFMEKRPPRWTDR